MRYWGGALTAAISMTFGVRAYVSRKGAPDVDHFGQMAHESVKAGSDRDALARAAAEESDALRVRAQARVDVAEGAL